MRMRMRMRMRFELAVVLALVVGVSSVSCAGVAVGVAQALPPGRHYEMVSPVHKGGFGATKINAVSPDGESVAYYSAGTFEEAPEGSGILPTVPDYLARRGASGWETVPLSPPASMLEFPFRDLSPSLSVEFAEGDAGPSVQNQATEQQSLWLHPTDLPDTEAGWQRFGELRLEGSVVQASNLEYIVADSNFCHSLFFTHGNTLLPEADGETEGTHQLYEFDRGCDGGSASVALVAVNNKDRIIERECPVNIGNEQYSSSGNEGVDNYNAISEDGGEVFFTDCTAAGSGEPKTPHQLFVRLGGLRTVEVSRPLEGGEFGGCIGEHEATPGEVPCSGSTVRPSADFAGASRDGSMVYFKTTAQLVAGDKDTSDDLYLARIGCSPVKPECQASEREVISLAQVSHDPNGGAAEVQGIVRVAPDGERAYFVASGDLLSMAQQQSLESEGRPVPQVGAANLYVYSAAGEGSVGFVADLCSGTARSGTVEDYRCPSANGDAKLWTSGGQDAGESQTAGPNGEFLVFATYAQLTSDDINQAEDVYRYDADTGVISRISIGEDGYEPNGARAVLGSSIAQGMRGGRLLEQYELGNRAISEDGSRIVFTSAEPLSPSDTNGFVNAYEWHENPNGEGGSTALVSTGSDQEPVHEVVISPSGLSVLFGTVQGLVPQDTDGEPDVYDARLGEGFPSAPAERQPCEGDGCQGPLTNPAPLLVPGSISQAPGGNLPPPVVVATKAKAKPKCKHGYARDKAGKCAKIKRKARKSVATHRSSHKSNRGGRS